MRVRLGVTLLGLLLPSALVGQTNGWRFTASPAAGLWFHSMALSGTTGFGMLPLYGSGYRGDLVRARARTGTPPTPLEQRSAEFGDAFVADSAFEVLHFVPLWFPVSTPSDLLESIRLGSERGESAIRQVGPRERFGLTALLATLPTPEERVRLVRLVDALRREWTAGYAVLQDVLLPDGRAAEVAAAWQPVAAALAPYLRARKLTGGAVLLVASLGPDGRFFAGDPKNPTDNVVAVRLGPGEPAQAAVYRLVRELCYPAVREAMQGTEPTDDRVRGERVSGIAAVRCGHELLARYAPREVAGYDEQWLREAGATEGFEEHFALPGAIGSRLASRIAGR